MSQIIPRPTLVLHIRWLSPLPQSSTFCPVHVSHPSLCPGYEISASLPPSFHLLGLSLPLISRNFWDIDPLSLLILTICPNLFSTSWSALTIRLGLLPHFSLAQSFHKWSMHLTQHIVLRHFISSTFTHFCFLGPRHASLQGLLYLQTPMFPLASVHIFLVPRIWSPPLSPYDSF